MFKSGNLELLKVSNPQIDKSSSDYEIDVYTLKTALQTLFLNCSVLEQYHVKMINTSDVVLEIEWKNTRGQSDNTDWLEHDVAKLLYDLWYPCLEMAGTYTCIVTVLLSSFNFRLITQWPLLLSTQIWYKNLSYQ